MKCYYYHYFYYSFRLNYFTEESQEISLLNFYYVNYHEKRPPFVC